MCYTCSGKVLTNFTISFTVLAARSALLAMIAKLIPASLRQIGNRAKYDML